MCRVSILILILNHRYAEGEECPEELVINFTVAQWSSNTVRDCITTFGARIIEVIIDCSCHLLFCCLEAIVLPSPHDATPDHDHDIMTPDM